MPRGVGADPVELSVAEETKFEELVRVRAQRMTTWRHALPAVVAWGGLVLSSQASLPCLNLQRTGGATPNLHYAPPQGPAHPLG